MSNLVLWGGHYENGAFIRYVSEVREGKRYGTGFHVADRGTNNHLESALSAKLAEAEQIGIDAAAEKYPTTFLRNQRG